MLAIAPKVLSWEGHCGGAGYLSARGNAWPSYELLWAMTGAAMVVKGAVLLMAPRNGNGTCWSGAFVVRMSTIDFGASAFARCRSSFYRPRDGLEQNKDGIAIYHSFGLWS